MAMQLDHFMWGAPTLETGLREAERLFSVRPAMGGSHPGLGTCNALLALGDVYLEVIAPDPAQSDPPQSRQGSFARQLAELETCALITWAAGSRDLKLIAAKASDRGLTVRGPSATQRRTPDDQLLSWELLFLSDHGFPNLVPFFIDWLDTTHPASSNPFGGEVVSFVLETPDASGLSDLLGDLEVDANIVSAREPRLTVSIQTANGLVVLESTDQTRTLSF